MKSILSFFALLTFPLYVTAQLQFTEGWRMDRDDNRNNLQHTSDGGYIISGTIQAPLSPLPQCYLMKVDSNGHQEWMTQFPVATLAYADAGNASVCQTPDGGYAIATSFCPSPPPSAQRMIYIVKTDGAGNLLWSRTYPGAGYSFSNCINVTADNGLIVAGSTIDTVNNLAYAYLLKTDSVGNLHWSSCYYPLNDPVTPSGYTGAVFASASQTSDGGFIAAGWMNSTSSQGSVVMKTDSSGAVTWCRGILSTPPEYVSDFDVKELPDGGFIACGEDYNVEYYSTLTRFSATGVPLWRKTYGTVDDIPFWTRNGSHAVVPAPDGFTISVGEYVSPGDRMRLVHTDTAGNPLWTRRYTMTCNTVGDVERTNDGGYAFTAYTPGIVAPHYLMLYKTDSLGIAPCDDYPVVSASFDLSLPVSVPLATMSIGVSGAWPTTLSPVVMSDSNMCQNVVPHGIGEASGTSAPSIFPNPAQQEVNVVLNNRDAEKVSIRLLNALGEVVAVQSVTGVHGTVQVRFDTHGLPPGMYFIAVEADGIPRSTGKVTITH